MRKINYAKYKEITGRMKNSKLIVRRKTIKRTLFISRLAPDTSIDDIRDHLNDHQIIFDNVTKLLSRFPLLYSSFIIDTDIDNFELLSDPEIWPDGCLIKNYFPIKVNKNSNLNDNGNIKNEVEMDKDKT